MANFFAFLYKLLSQLRNQLYFWKIFHQKKLPGKTLSVGNLTVGGTGKSPIVIELAQALVDQSKNPAILTRGYQSGLKKNEYIIYLNNKVVLSNHPNPDSINPDEAKEQSSLLPTVPIIVGALRYTNAQTFMHKFPKPTHWLLDDGFQHRKIARDLDILCLDSYRPFGNYKLLPSGFLRESLQGLYRAHEILLTRWHCSHINQLNQFDPKLRSKCVQFNCDQFFSLNSQSIVQRLPDAHSYLLVLGISQPKRLLQKLQENSLAIADHLFFKDHQKFNQNKIMESIPNDNPALLTTWKDYHRQKEVFASLPCPVFLINLKVELLDSGGWNQILKPVL